MTKTPTKVFPTRAYNYVSGNASRRPPVLRGPVPPTVAPLAQHATADQRILANTPCLKALYDFLARPLPWEGNSK